MLLTSKLQPHFTGTTFKDQKQLKELEIMY